MSDDQDKTINLPPCGDDLCVSGCTVCREGGPLDTENQTTGPDAQGFVFDEHGNVEGRVMMHSGEAAHSQRERQAGWDEAVRWLRVRASSHSGRWMTMDPREAIKSTAEEMETLHVR